MKKTYKLLIVLVALVFLVLIYFLKTYIFQEYRLTRHIEKKYDIKDAFILVERKNDEYILEILEGR